MYISRCVNRKKLWFMHFLFIHESGKERKEQMIEEIERCLSDNGDLDETARRLIDKANEQRNDRLNEIQHDITFAKLIREALNEPQGTGMYMIARAYIREYKRKYYPKGKYKLAVELMHEVKNNERD